MSISVSLLLSICLSISLSLSLSQYLSLSLFLLSFLRIDYWARFEKFVKDLTKTYDHVYVATGPLILPTRTPQGTLQFQYPALGTPPRVVTVPTHFYKVILGEARNGQRLVVGAFVMPNEPIAPATPLPAFAVPVASLEQVSGLRFFPAMGDALGMGVGVQDADRSAIAWQNAGRAMQDRVLLLKGGRGGKGGGSGMEKKMMDMNGKIVVPREELDAFYLRKRGAVREGKVTHICDDVKCELPRENFWQGGGGRASGGGSGGGGGRGTMRR